MMATLAKLPPDLLTVPQAAKRLGIGNDLAYKMADRGELAGAFRVGRHWRVSVVQLERFINGELPEAG